MSERFEHQHDLSSPPSVVRWDLDERPSVYRSQEKVCAVRLGLSMLGISERYVRGLRQVESVTPIPRTPKNVIGVTALAGAIVPLLDISSALGMSGLRLKAPWTGLLVESGGMKVLLAVEEVVAFEATAEPETDENGEADEERLAWTTGSIPIFGRPVPLLDLPKLLLTLRGET